MGGRERRPNVSPDSPSPAPGLRHPPLRRLDASARGAALDAGAAGRDSDGLADGHALRPPAQRRRGAAAARRTQRGGHRGAAQPHGRAAVPGRASSTSAPPTVCRRASGSWTDLAARVRSYPKSEVSDVRTGFAAERAFVEKHAGSLIGARRSEDDPRADRGAPALGVRQEDRHAARRRRAGAAARLLATSRRSTPASWAAGIWKGIASPTASSG